MAAVRMDRWRSLGVRGKILALVAVVAVPLVAYIGYQLFHLYDDLRSTELQRTERGATVIAVTLNRFFHQLAEEGQAVGLAVEEGRMSPEEARTYLASLGRHVPISNYALFDAEGRVVASLDPTRAAPLAKLGAFQAALRGDRLSITYVVQDPKGRPKLVVMTPLAPERGVIAVSVDTSSLAGVLPPEAGQGVVIVTDARGRLVYTNSPSLPSSITLRFPIVVRALGGHASYATDVSLPGLSGAYLGAQVPVASVGWTAGIYRPADTAFEHVGREMAYALAAILTILVVAGLAARSIALGILSPLERLTAAAERLREGDLQTPVEVRTRDEVGVLADAFRDMQAGLRHAFASLGGLARAGRRLNEAVGVADVAKGGLDSFADLLRAEAAVVSLHLPGSQPERFETGPEEALALVDELSAGVPSAALAEAGWHLMPEPGPARSRVLVSLVLVQEHQALGRIDALVMPERGIQEFEASDLRLAEGLAEQFSVALVNAQRFETESSVAETLQDSLITEPFPVPSTDLGVVYRPAVVGARIGGDFYDLIRFSERMFVLAVGDISGHGLAAAGHVVAAKGAIRSFALDDPSPATVLARADAALIHQLPPGMFVTAFCALYDTETGRLRYASAGHPAPFVLSAEGRISQLLIGGSPLGLPVPGVYGESAIVLEPGEQLVAYTDGLTEARPPAGELLGDRRVAEVAAREAGRASEDLAEALAAAADLHARGELPDDLTVVVLKRLAPVVVEVG